MSWHAKSADIARSLPAPPSDTYPEGVPFRPVLSSGSMLLELFAPRCEDRQEPHDQDELYLVLSGSSGFERDGERVECEAGDALFVPAGMAHRFVDISDDFCTWVVFWGPTGGEGRVTSPASLPPSRP